VKSENDEIPHSADFSILQILLPSQIKIPSSVPSTYVIFPYGDRPSFTPIQNNS
jgi:hypothetical protein